MTTPAKEPAARTPRSHLLYRRALPGSWTGETARAIRRRGGPEGLLVMHYLMTGPFTNMIGLYRLVVGYMGAETGLGDVGAAKGLRACVDAGFCQYDPDSEFVWIPEFAKYQIAESLQPKDKRCKGLQNAYDAIQDNPFLPCFYDRYVEAFHLTRRRTPKGGEAVPTDLFGPIPGANFEAPSKPGDRRQETGDRNTPYLSVGGPGGASADAPAPPAPPLDLIGDPPTPPAPPPPAKVKAAKTKAAPKEPRATWPRQRKAPAEWMVTVDMQRWAREKFPEVDLRAEAEKFRDHEFPRPYSDWDATFRNWVRGAAPRYALGARTPVGKQTALEQRNTTVALEWAGAAAGDPA